MGIALPGREACLADFKRQNSLARLSPAVPSGKELVSAVPAHGLGANPASNLNSHPSRHAGRQQDWEPTVQSCLLTRERGI